jgi:hypothetical protein
LKSPTKIERNAIDIFSFRAEIQTANLQDHKRKCHHLATHSEIQTTDLQDRKPMCYHLATLTLFHQQNTSLVQIFWQLLGHAKNGKMKIAENFQLCQKLIALL